MWRSGLAVAKCLVTSRKCLTENFISCPLVWALGAGVARWGPLPHTESSGLAPEKRLMSVLKR